MDAKERYFWDITGYLVVKNVLSTEELKIANEAIDSDACFFVDMNSILPLLTMVLKTFSRATLVNSSVCVRSKM